MNFKVNNLFNFDSIILIKFLLWTNSKNICMDC